MGVLEDTLSGMHLTLREPTPEEMSGIEPYDPEPGLTSRNQLPQNMNALSGLLNFRQDQAAEPPPKIKMETDERGQPQWSVDLSDKQMKGIMGKMSYLEQALQAMTAETQRLQAQEQRARQNPLLHVLSTVAGNLAAGDPRLPPVVSALGRANLQLNPPPELLAQRRMGLLETMGDLEARRTTTLDAALRLGMEKERIGLEERRLQETERSHQQTEKDRQRDKALQAVRLIAQKGGGAMEQKAFDAAMRSYGVTDPELIKDAYLTHQEMAGVVVKGKEAEQQKKEAIVKTRADLALRNRITALHENFALQTSPTKMAFEGNLHKLKKDVDNAAMSDRELKVVGQKDLQKLTQANATDAYVDKVEYMFNQPEWKAVAGPVFQFNPKGGPNGQGEFKINPQAALPKAFQNIPRTEADSMISHEIPRLLTLMLNGQAGGASILRIEAGQKLIRDMGVTGAVRPDQIAAIMKIVRDTNNENKAAVMRTHPEVDWSKRKWLLSSDTPQNRQFFYGRKTAWGSTVQPIPDLTGGEPGGDPTDPLGVKALIQKK